MADKEYKRKQKKKEAAIKQLQEQIQATKQQLLEQEGIIIRDEDISFDIYCYRLQYHELMAEYMKLKKQIAKAVKNNSYSEGYKQGYRAGFNAGNAPFTSYKNSANYTKQEKKLLKEGFKLLAMKHHPDRGGTTEEMIIINNLKDKIL